MKTVTVQMRCMNTETDGTPIYVDRHGSPSSTGKQLCITVEPKRRMVKKFCPIGVSLGKRRVLYLRPTTAPAWMITQHCRCHDRIRLGN